MYFINLKIMVGYEVWVWVMIIINNVEWQNFHLRTEHVGDDENTVSESWKCYHYFLDFYCHYKIDFLSSCFVRLFTLFFIETIEKWKIYFIVIEMNFVTHQIVFNKTYDPKNSSPIHSNLKLFHSTMMNELY